MVEAEAQVQNYAGIHVRPSGVIIQAVQDYPGTICVDAKGMQIDLTNIMGLIAMGLTQGDSVKIQVDGPDEEAELEKLCELFSRNFDFPPRGSA